MKLELGFECKIKEENSKIMAEVIIEEPFIQGILLFVFYPDIIRANNNIKHNNFKLQ